MDNPQEPSGKPAIDSSQLQTKSPSFNILFIILLICFLLFCAGLYILLKKNKSSDSIIKIYPTTTQIPSPTQTDLQSIPNDWKFYKSDKQYFSINYPGNWFLNEVPIGSGTNQNFLGGVLIANVPQDKFTFSTRNKAVWIYPAKKDKDWTLEEWAKKTIITENSKLIDQQNITINNVPALKLTLNYSSKAPTEITYILLEKDSLGWVIMYFSPTDQSSSQELDQITKTFKLLSTSTYVEQIEMLGLSMDPTLKSGQRYSIDRKVFTTSKPNRGDIVFVEKPDKPEIQIIKRVIGIPGDIILIKDGKVFINQTILDEPYLSSPNSTFLYSPEFIKEGEDFTIPQDHYFVMGDNRPHSSDSREWGYVTTQNIKAKINTF